MGCGVYEGILRRSPSLWRVWVKDVQKMFYDNHEAADGWLQFSPFSWRSEIDHLLRLLILSTLTLHAHPALS